VDYYIGNLILFELYCHSLRDEPILRPLVLLFDVLTTTIILKIKLETWKLR